MLFICGPQISGFSAQDASRIFNIFLRNFTDGFMSKPYKFGSFTLGGGGGGGGGGIYPILLHPNTCDIYLLLFYTTVSLDFGCGPISELTTHSPTMVNNSTMHPHRTRCDVTVHMKCKDVISCYVMLHAQ